MTNQQKNNYLFYLETKVLTNAYRIGELEAALLYILNLNDHKHNKDKVYIQATNILHSDFSYSNETTEKYKELLNG